VVEPIKPVAAIHKSGSDISKNSSTIADEVKIEQKEKKELYETVCDTCEQKIYVPFKPDPNRPAFCKECLKDYQRALAKARNPQAANNQQQAKDNQLRPIVVKKQEADDSGGGKEVARKVYVPQDKPMSLSQMSHIAPKKFKTVRQKPQINLGDVRELINKTKKDDGKQG